MSSRIQLRFKSWTPTVTRLLRAAERVLGVASNERGKDGSDSQRMKVEPRIELLRLGIEKSSVSRQFVAASSNQLRVLCERRLEDLNLVVLMIDGIHFGGQVLVV